MAKDKGDVMLSAQVSRPVPAKSGFNTDDDMVQVSKDQLKEQERAGLYVPLHFDFGGGVDDTHLHFPGIQNNATVIFVLLADHNPPHFHARYGSEKVAIEIETLRILEGNLSPRALGLVIEWAAQHKKELLQNWELTKNSQTPKKIEPLR